MCLCIVIGLGQKGAGAHREAHPSKVSKFIVGMRRKLTLPEEEITAQPQVPLVPTHTKGCPTCPPANISSTGVISFPKAELPPLLSELAQGNTFNIAREVRENPKKQFPRD